MNSNLVYQNWLAKINDKKIRKELSLYNAIKVENNFSQKLTFGTAGMRGVMEYGTNNLNEVMASKLADSLAKYIIKNGLKNGVAICYDTRKNSKKYANYFARVLDLNNIKVYLFKDFAPTPLSVFATKIKSTDFGVMITASHNKKQYNGIKVYDCNGIQIDNKTQQEISQIFNESDEISIFNSVFKHKLSKNVEFLKKNVLNSFINSDTDNTEKTLKIVYTPLNGTGLYCVKNILKNNNYKIRVPKKQTIYNGEFATCPYPNPEFKEAFNESLILAKKEDADIIVATDPDADRLGVMVKHNGQYIKLSGNEVGYIFAEYLGSKNKNENKFLITSVVTSPLIEDITKGNNITIYKTLTGFMSLGTKMHDLIKKYGEESFVLTYEESCGYVVKSSYYDKDGVYATLLLCNMAEELKRQNKTLIDYLNDIYNKYGYMAVVSDSVVFEGNNSKKDMQNVVNTLRKNAPKTILNQEITKVVDYQNDKTGYPKQNFLEYHSKDIKFIIRPSGTEPKLKIYLFVKGNKDQADEKANLVLNEIKTKLLKNER